LPVFYQKFNFNFNLDFNNYSAVKYLLPIILFGLILVWSIIRVTPNIILINNRLKQTWILLLNHLIVSIVVVGFAMVKNGSEVLFLIFPTGIILGNFIPKLKSKLLRNVLLFMFLALSISVYFL
jgi:hypothetical protein